MLKFDTAGLESYLPDHLRESEIGVWLSFPGDRKFRCLRAGGSNKRFIRAFQAAIKPHRRQMDRGTLDPEVSEQIMREVYSRTVVLDWKGIKDAEGQDVPYSPEAAVELFKAVPEMFNDITTLCADMAVFTDGELEDAKQVLGEA